MSEANDFGMVTTGRFVRSAAVAGWEPRDMEEVGSDQDILRGILLVKKGMAEIRPIDHAFDLATIPELPFTGALIVSLYDSARTYFIKNS